MIDELYAVHYAIMLGLADMHQTVYVMKCHRGLAPMDTRPSATALTWMWFQCLYQIIQHNYHVTTIKWNDRLCEVDNRGLSQYKYVILPE